MQSRTGKLEEVWKGPEQQLPVAKKLKIVADAEREQATVKSVKPQVITADCEVTSTYT